MHLSTATKSNLSKILRVLLVFALVFWGSLRVEALAFAGMKVVEGHEDDALTNLTAYQVDPDPVEGNKTGLGALLGAADSDDAGTKDAGKGAEVVLEGVGSASELVVVPSWNGGKPEIDEKTGDVEVVPFVTWSVGDPSVASVEMDEKKGVSTLTGKAVGTTTVTCELDLSAVEGLDVSEFPEKGKGKIEFKVTVVEPVVEESHKVTKLELFDEDDKLLADSTSKLELPKAIVGTPYALKVNITVSTYRDGEESSSEVYETVAAARNAGVRVSWSLMSGGDIADISDDTSENDVVFTMREEGSVQVHVEASIGAESVQADVTAYTQGSNPGSGDPGDEPEPVLVPVTQGKSNPQDVLTVVSNARAATGTGDNDSEASGAEGAERVDEDSAASADDGEAGSRAASGSSSSSSASDGQDENGQMTGSVEKTYSAADLEALGTERATFTMYNEESKFVTVTGEGPYLIALLRDIGIDNTDQIESLAFENAEGVSTTVNWADFESANRYYPHAYEGDLQDSTASSPIIALSSLVRGYGDGTGEGADVAASDEGSGDDGVSSGSGSSGSNSSGDSSGDASSSSSVSGSSDAASTDGGLSTDVALLDNTRFRVLFGSTSPARAIADPEALCWVNKITVNVKPAEEEPRFDTDIAVSVEYVPVPIGAPAVFMALPNTEIRDARFDFNWEVSTDGGKTWEAVENGNVQGLRVVTTKERLGNQYRVIMETNASDKSGRENVTVTSKPVTMVEGNGLAVVLEYDPPVAGQTAFFQTTLYGAESGVPIEYTWEQSQDGGVTWRPIPGRTGSSLAVPTEPIDPDAEPADDDEVVPITYIHVIAKETAGQEREAISEAVPLTVHVNDGDDGGDGSGDTPVSPGTDKPDPSVDPVDDKPTPRPPRVTPVDDITIEPPSSYEPSVSSTVPMENGSRTQQVNPSQLYINESVTEQVNEQQEAVENYIESTVPGARWASLTSSQATGDDVHNILADNPFAPFVAPTGLGITIAGGLEKLLAFRRQTK